MTPARSAHELALLLRARLPDIEDGRFVATLAQVARTSPAQPAQRRVPRFLKIGAASVTITATVFGGAYAADTRSPSPEPAVTRPNSPQSDVPANPPNLDPAPSQGPLREPDGDRDLQGSQTSAPPSVPSEPGPTGAPGGHVGEAPEGDADTRDAEPETEGDPDTDKPEGDPKSDDDTDDRPDEDRDEKPDQGDEQQSADDSDDERGPDKESDGDPESDDPDISE